MNRTAENLLTWASLGAGVALFLSDHRPLGAAVAAIAPITAISQHPRGTRKLLKAVPRGFTSCSKSTTKAFKRAGREMGRSAREAGKGLRWLAS